MPLVFVTYQTIFILYFNKQFAYISDHMYFIYQILLVVVYWCLQDSYIQQYFLDTILTWVGSESVESVSDVQLVVVCPHETIDSVQAETEHAGQPL